MAVPWVVSPDGRSLFFICFLFKVMSKKNDCFLW